MGWSNKMKTIEKNLFSMAKALLILLCVSGSVFAQTTTSSEAKGGSVYSAVGLGSPLDITTSIFKSQGIFGLTNVGREATTLSNPALWGGSFYTQASSGLELTNLTIKDSFSKSKSTNLQASYLHLLFPVSAGKLGLSIGLYPVTSAGFRVISDETFVAEGDSIGYNNELQSFGGVNKFEIGLGFKLSNSISIGYAPSIAFLNIENTESVTFSSTQFVPQSQTSQLTGATFSQRFGITGSFDNIFREEDRLSVGATINLPFTITTKEKVTTDKLVDGLTETIDISDNLARTKGEVSLPLEMALGVGFAPSKFVNFSLEGQVQKWGDFSNELRPEDELQMSDRTKIGFGGQFHPYRRISRSFFSSFKYSGGVSYDTGHLTIQNEDISTLWLNTGLGILARNASTIDLSLQFGFRGTTNNDLFQENIWKLGVSINLTERMFRREKLR